MSMKDVVIVSACRTPIGAFGGSLKDIHAYKIASTTMKEAVKRAGISPDLINDVRYGCCLEPYNALNVARVAALDAGIPETATAVTINRVCISGMEAVVSGMAMIQAGLVDVILAGGVEHMSGVPYSVPAARWGCRLQNQNFEDISSTALHCGSRLQPGPRKRTGQGRADHRPLPAASLISWASRPNLIAQMHNISREEMDEVALRSHNNAERATIQGAISGKRSFLSNFPRKKASPPRSSTRMNTFGLT